MSADSNSAPAEGDIWDPTIDARDPRRSATHREGQERGQEQPRAQPHKERERHRRERGERRDARHRARPRSRAPRSRWLKKKISDDANKTPRASRHRFWFANDGASDAIEREESSFCFSQRCR